MKPEDIILAEVCQSLQKTFDQEIRIIDKQSVTGGDINNALKLSTSHSTFFVKYNNGKAYPNMFQAEAKGLKILRASGEISIPEVICFEQDFLVLNYIEETGPNDDFWTSFGYQLANLHRHSNESYGLDHNNYIGSLRQFNDQKSSWSEFFVSQRLSIQCKIARDRNRVDKGFVRMFEKLYYKIEQLVPEEKPSLLHGDLWSGNFLVSTGGNPVIVDPAIYYGHREMDIGMSKLFGGFDQIFYNAYNEEYPLYKGWEERIDIANLYPLLVHVNLFGGSYIHQVEHIVKRFV